MKTYLKNLTPEEIIKRLKNGEIIKFDEDKTFHIKVIDGIICRIVDKNNFVINAVFDNENFYFETEEPFKIKKIGLYKTRGGRKVFVSDISVNTDRTYKISGIIEGDTLSSNWTVYGSAVESGDYESADDIISKWED